MSEKSIFNRQSVKVEAPQQITNLEAGKHLVRIVGVYHMDSFMSDTKGTQKENLPEFSDATPQLGILFANDEGSFFHRYNGAGYTRYEDLSDAEKKSGDYKNIEGYACFKTDDGWERLANDEKSDAAFGILSQLTESLGSEEGSDILESIESAAANKTELVINIAEKSYTNKDGDEASNLRVSFTAKAEEMVEEDAEVEEEKF